MCTFVVKNPRSTPRRSAIGCTMLISWLCHVMPEQANLQTPASNPVLADFGLPYSAVFYPLGYPVRIESNSREVIAAASRRWSAFSQRSDHRPVRISIGVSKTAAGFTGAPPVYRSRDHLMSIVSGAENFVSCDFNSGVA